MRRLLGLGLLLAAGSASAQDKVPWRASYFPYLIGNPATGVMLVAHYQLSRQADYEDRVPHDGLFAVDGGVSAQGSRLLTAKFRGPLLVAGWRFAADAGAVREARYGYSLANTGGLYDPQDSASAFPGDADQYNRVHRSRYFGRMEVTRRISGPLHVAGMLGVEQAAWSRMPGASFFRADHGAGLSQTDVGGRLSLVLDLRDREFLTEQGVFAEAGLLFGGGGEHVSGNLVVSGSYTGWYSQVRVYVSPRRGTVVAGRVAARSVGRTATLQARNTLPAWEGGADALGGAYAHRGLRPGRMAGRGLLLSSLELRHTLLDVGDYGAVTLLGFVDGGRVFEREDFEFTTKGWQVGGGGGVALRVLQSGLLTFHVAGGPEGLVFSMGTGWSF